NLALIHVPGRERATARAVEAIRVRAGEDTTADLRIIEGRPLRGVAIDLGADAPLANTHIGCYGPARPRSTAMVQVTRTDDEGRFTFYVPPGEQYVYLMDDGGRLSSRTIIIPEEGAAEPVRLARMPGSRRDGVFTVT